MPNTLTLSDGATTIDLATVSGSGIRLIHLALDPPQRVIQRTSSFPFVDGQRTVASALSDRTATFTCDIVDTTDNALDAQLQGLVRMLEAARVWEEQRVGTPVRLAFKRPNETNTAYWVLTGVPQYPTPVDPGGDLTWMDEATVNHVLTITFQLTLEPVAHSDTLATIVSAVSVTNVLASNTVTSSATTGDMPGPLAVTLAAGTMAASWQTVYLALMTGGSSADRTDFSSTVDANASGGSAQTMVGASDSVTVAAVTLASKHRLPLRGFLRLRSLDATKTTKIQARLDLRAGNTLQTGQWVTMPAAGTSYYLLDLGTFRLSSLFDQPGATSITYTATVNVRTSDGSTVSVLFDYLEIVPYLALSKLQMTFGVPVGGALVYEAVHSNGGFVWPRPSIRVYDVTSTGVYSERADRYGALGTVPPGQTVTLWTAMQTATVHTITDTATVTIKQLPCYAIGLRGAG
jgi:hypothetical protein